MVFEATNESTKGALKIFDPELVERFGTEVQAARIERERALIGKHHPHLVRILDGGFCTNTRYFYIVMELVAGKQLAEVLETLPRDRIWPCPSPKLHPTKESQSLNG